MSRESTPPGQKRSRTRPDTGSRARARAKAWQPLFLEKLAETGVVLYACRAAEVARSTVYEARSSDPEFAAAWEAAEEESVEVLELEARRRAFEGVDEPVFQGGQRVGEVRRYSDRLLEFLLKARAPERFSERHRLEHSGKVSGGLTLTQLGELLRDDEGDVSA